MFPIDGLIVQESSRDQDKDAVTLSCSGQSGQVLATQPPRLHPLQHYGRAEQGLITEFIHSFGQLNLSGDDMNIIQVGRPAVSRYHQISKFFAEGEGPDYAVHDFPNAAYGIKLGGFMVRGGHLLAEDGKARYLD